MFNSYSMLQKTVLMKEQNTLEIQNLNTLMTSGHGMMALSRSKMKEILIFQNINFHFQNKIGHSEFHLEKIPMDTSD